MNVLKAILFAVLLLVVVGGVVIALLLQRGFRATTTPTVFEAKIARTLRNRAIPRDQRKLKNPVAPSSEALQRGREYFLRRCANCHGIDGSGKTQIGVNLYPRVPDLRASDTETLTDGEIHYLIENGVQHTGMPAWGNSENKFSNKGWELVLFVRSLRLLSNQHRSEQIAITSAKYVGSEACEKCHDDIYRRWKKTPMANVVRDPRLHLDAIIPDHVPNTEVRFTTDQVGLVYGSIWKQRYFTKKGDDYFPLPVQWDIGNRAWRPYMVPSAGGDWWGALYPPDNMQRPTGPTCDGCHSVYYNIHTKQVAEWNVGCERCHGPGSEHVNHPTRENIIDPARMDNVAETDTCMQCHSQGQPRSNPIEGKFYDWPVGYQVGLELQNFWKLEDCMLGQTTFYYFPDCTAHKNRMQGNDFVQSVMYRHGITCTSCHDVHGTANYAQLREPENLICLDCHGPSSPNGPRAATVQEHTHHKDGSPGSDCVACHMPAIETEGVPGAFVHAHTFRVVSPSMTDKYKIPNPCTSCHKDKSAAWAEDAIRHWPQLSPWKAMF